MSHKDKPTPPADLPPILIQYSKDGGEPIQVRAENAATIEIYPEGLTDRVVTLQIRQHLHGDFSVHRAVHAFVTAAGGERKSQAKRIDELPQKFTVIGIAHPQFEKPFVLPVLGEVAEVSPRIKWVPKTFFARITAENAEEAKRVALTRLHARGSYHSVVVASVLQGHHHATTATDISIDE